MLRRDLVASRTEAQRLIGEGKVEVRGVPTPKAATLVTRDTPISVVDPDPGYVGRGALKLEGALEAFGVAVAGRHALDVGASTGGFTEVLLRRGASRVVALDAGRGQLHAKLRADPRVTPMERTNVRYTTPADTGGSFPLIVADLSFISLCTVAPALAALAEPGADLILLVKPQFEAGREEVGKGGVVRDQEVRRRAVEKVIACLDHAGIGAVAAVPSVIEGADGNREVFLWARSGVPARPDLEVPV